ncbi:MAG: bifunctional diguanylate cyclase/phosphodiesterase, partial [Thermoanaerobaculia bacterium]
VVMQDIHRHEEGTIALTFAAPLLVTDVHGQRAVGAIVLELDPAEDLMPLVARWPLPSPSGESLLVRREGDSALYLSALRHRQGSSLSLRLPLTAKNLIAARALRGDRGTIEGIDYRNVSVLASARNVAGSSWVLISKIDSREIQGTVVESAQLVALFGMVLVLAAGLTTALWLRQQRANAWIQHYRAEQERMTLTRQLDHLTRHANDIILLMDDQGRLLDANDRAVAAYGRSREDLIGSSIAALRPPEQRKTFDAEWSRAQQQPEGMVFEAVHQRKDGSTFPVEVSTRAIPVDGTVLRQSIIRDISERKDAEAKIRRLGNIYAALSQINQAIVRGESRQNLLSELCRVSVEFALLEFAWVGLVETSTGMVRAAASNGADRGYSDHIEFSTDPRLPSGHGPMSIAIRERRTYVCNDFESDPAAAPLRERAARAGFRALAAIPLSCEGVAIGALAVYAGDPRYFDEQTIVLLGEMADDVSYALDSIAGDERRIAAEEALRESEEKYRLLFSNEQDAIVIFDAATIRIIDANPAFFSLSGYSREEAFDLTAEQFSPDPDEVQAAMREVRERGSHRLEVQRFRRRDGSEIRVEIGLNTFDSRGQHLVSAILRDITHRKDAEERALLWANILESSAEAIIIADAQRRAVQVNRAFTHVTGYEADEVIGRDPGFLSSPAHDATFYARMWRTVGETGRWQGEIWNRRRNGEVYPGWLSITSVHNAAGELTHYVGVFSDITERKASADRIEFLANHDSLTGLPNRSVMNERIQQSLAMARRKGSHLAVLFLDLDRFKTINDSLGHPVGDMLLQQIAARLTGSIREEDSVSRLGGDEFLILLPQITRAQDAAVVADKVLAALRDPIEGGEHTLRITGSIGISIYPDDAVEVAALIKNADAAMYHAKERGRNNCQFFTHDMNARAFEAFELEMSLRGAVGRDEFTLEYQPQADAITGRITAAEALIRWDHPELGRISPAGFIPIAEEHGMIVAIGEWVLRTVCMQVRRWLDEGLDVVPIAVNMSAVQFRQSSLPSRVRTILEECGVAPRYLELELTESIVMRDAELTIALLEELSEMGVSLAIDDFGTGYSSLSYLRRFPLDRLKIDQSFVRDLPTNPDAAAIAAAIIGMGRSMKLRVVAEGVETAEQLAFLIDERCDELQGFHIARPMSAEHFSALLRARQPLVGAGRMK